MLSYKIEEWSSEVEEVEYSDYWNNEAQDMENLVVLDGDFSRMENYLVEINVISQLEACINAAKDYFSRNLHGVGADLAAGNLLGNHYFTNSQYQRLFHQHDFEYVYIYQSQWRIQAFVVIPKQLEKIYDC